MKRREFLKGTSLAVGAAVIAGCSPHIAAAGAGKKGSILVLGAGLSGLSAALKLTKAGFSVTILEARSRLGGRVFTSTFGAAPQLSVELGAEWVGESHERIKAFCQDFGLTLDEHRFEEHLYLGGAYQPFRSWTYEKQWNEKFKSILEGYRQMNDAQKKEMDKMDWWRYLVNNGISEKDLNIRELIDSTDFGESIRFVSADMAAAEYAESSPANEMDYKIQGGNSRLVEELANRVGKDMIKTSHKVITVEQSRAGIKATCENGAVFEADKMICTIPTFAIGKIKWEPGLPKEKQEAINSLQYARIYKNCMLFKDRFWKEEKFAVVTDMPGHYFFHSTQNQPNEAGVLTSYSIGDKAQMLHMMNKDQREQLICGSIPSTFDSVKDNLVQTAGYYWGNDNYSMGAYAIYGKGQWYKERLALQKPFGGVHFAGEHLADWQGFMEGAIVSGEEAAGELI